MLRQLTATKKWLQLWLAVTLILLPVLHGHAQIIPVSHWKMDDVEFRSAGTTLSACPLSGTSYGVVLSKPSGVVANDLLFAQIWISNSTNGKTITPPAGWTEIRNDTQFNGSWYVRQYLFYKVAGSSEPSTYTFTGSAVNCTMGVITAYKNVKTIAPVDVHSCSSGNTDSEATAPSITTTKYRTRIVYTLLDAWQATTNPMPWLYTRDLLYDAGNESNGSFVEDRQLGAAGATGTTEAWVANGNPWVSCQVALKPSGTITLRSVSGYVYVDGSSTVTVPKPSGLISGDLMIAVVTLFYGGSTNITYTPPAGWTQLRNDGYFDGYNSVRQVILYKVAGGSEPANYTFTGSSNSGGPETRGAIIAYSAVDTTTPFDGNNCTTGNATPGTAPSITTTVANGQLLYLLAQQNNHTTGPEHGAPELTQRWLLASGSDSQTIFGADRLLTNPGSTGDRKFVTSYNNQWLACQVALVPVR